MINIKKKYAQRIKRIKRVRKKIFGTSERPRVALTQTNRYLYVQAIDDEKGHTIIGMFSGAKELELKGFSKKNKKCAEVLAEVFAEKLKSKKINSIVFDRRFKKYTGVVKSFADKLREKGIKF